MAKKTAKKRGKKPMKGIILAGGNATRLYPNTLVTSKQLLPVYDRPMIFYPLNTLIKAGVKDILIIVSPEHAGDFINLLGDILENRGINISFRVQKEPRGLPEAFVLGENHIDKNNVALILGDNIFQNDFSHVIKNFKSGGHVFATEVSDPERFGVVKFNDKKRAMRIVEKPKHWISSYAVTGLYIYDSRVVEVAKKLKPSKRGELEIVDLHNWYLKRGELHVTTFKGAWLDAGTHESLLDAANTVRERKINDNFHPILQQAMKDYSNKHKDFVKKKLK